MPSASYERWQQERMIRLDQIDKQCGLVLASPTASPLLVDENLRGYVMALSAHFQGFSRDLYTETSQILVSKVRRPALTVLFQLQFEAHRKLDKGNPNLDNLKADFGRFGFNLDLPRADPANPLRLSHLSALNEWRNIAAHQGTPTAKAGSLTYAAIATWRASCDGLALSLDGILYNRLRSVLNRKPW